MKTFKKVLCIAGVVILVTLYVLTFIFGIFYKKGFHGMFMASVYSTFIIPVLMYAMMLMYKVLKNRGNDTDKSK